MSTGNSNLTNLRGLSEIGVDHEHSALGLAEGCALCGGRGYIRWTVFFMYPYVFVAGPNKHDTLLIIACANGTRNSTRPRLSPSRKRG